ncbi:unnamed protein product, partial [Pylaiella littoralis]
TIGHGDDEDTGMGGGGGRPLDGGPGRQGKNKKPRRNVQKKEESNLEGAMQESMREAREMADLREDREDKRQDLKEERREKASRTATCSGRWSWNPWRDCVLMSGRRTALKTPAGKTPKFSAWNPIRRNGERSGLTNWKML